jgi:hypothetical protein
LSFFREDFFSWLERRKFYIRDSWNFEKGKWAGAGTLRLFPFQERILKHVLTQDEDGVFPYTTIVYSTPKKSGKTLTAASVGAWFAEDGPEGGELYTIANSLDQAEGRVMKDVKYHFKQRREREENQDWKISEYEIKNVVMDTSVKALTQSFRSNAGTRHSLTLWDELWGARSEADLRMWDEMTPIPTIPYSLRFIVTYAGFINESELLWNLYLQGVGRQEHMDGQGTAVEGLEDIRSMDGEPVCWENKKARLFIYWDHEPRMPWQNSVYYCLPLESSLKVLTVDGWKVAEDVTVEDQLATRSESGAIEYQQPTSIFRAPYQGQLMRLKHTKANLVMTPNHRVLAAYASHTRKVKDILSRPFEYEYREAQDAVKAQVGWIPGHGQWDHEPLQTITVGEKEYEGTAFIEFMAWYLSDGYVKYRKYVDGTRYADSVFISQDREVNPQKYATLMDVCDRAGIAYTCAPNGLFISDKALAKYLSQFGKSYEKHIPRLVLNESSAAQLQSFLRMYVLGDGTVAPNGMQKLYTNSDRMMLDLTELAFKCGYRPTVHGPYSSAPGRKGIYHIHLLESHIGWSQGNKRTPWKYEDAPEGTEVWCPTLPNSNFCVMQNGFVWWTGNSEQLTSLRPAAYLRLHENRWVTSTEQFIPAEWWDYATSLQQSGELWEGHPYRHLSVYVGVDASVKRDCTAVVGVAINPATGMIGEVFHKIWTPVEGQDFDLEGAVIDYLRMQRRRFNLALVGYDPTFLHQVQMRLKAEGFVMKEITQTTSHMTEASQALYDALKGKRFQTFPDPEARAHIQNAVAKQEGRGIRIVKAYKPSERSAVRNKPIDYAIALAMAIWTAVNDGGIDISKPVMIESPFSDMTEWGVAYQGSQDYLPFPLRTDI